MFYSCVHGTCTYLYHVYSKRYQIVIVTRNQNFEIFKSVIDFRRYRTCAYCEWCGLLNARNSSFEIYLYREFSEYYRYNVDTPLRVVFNDDNLFKNDLLSRHATIRDLLSHRMGIPGNNAIRLDTNLTRENLIQ